MTDIEWFLLSWLASPIYWTPFWIWGKKLPKIKTKDGGWAFRPTGSRLKDALITAWAVSSVLLCLVWATMIGGILFLAPYSVFLKMLGEWR